MTAPTVCFPTVPSKEVTALSLWELQSSFPCPDPAIFNVQVRFSNFCLDHPKFGLAGRVIGGLASLKYLKQSIEESDLAFTG
jgi:hypothetical protein